MPGHEPAPTAAVPFQPMGPGAILGAAFGSYRRRWPTLLAVMAVAVPIAVSVPSTRVMPGPGGEYRVVLHHRVVATGGSWAATAIVTLAMLAGVLALTVVAGAVTRAAAAAVAGEDLGVAPSYRFGIGRTWPLLGVLLTTWLCTVLGAVLLIVPGVVVGVLLAVAVPALVVEGLGARAALSRSLELVRGQWWHAFGTILLTWLLLGLAVNLVLNAVGGFGHGWLARTAAQALAILLATPYAALVGVLLHLDLRARKEPPGAELVRPELGPPGPRRGRRYRVAMTVLSRRRHVELQAFRGYGTPARLRLRGRVLRSTGLVRSRLGDSVVDNLRNMFRRFESDEVPGALVAARAAAGGEVRARTDQEGYFEVVLDPPRPLDGARVWEPVELELLEPAAAAGTARATGQVLVPRDPQYAVISDLDDTVLHSNATSLWQMARLTLLHNAHTRLPFEGVAGFYQALQRGRDGEAYNPVFYVSNGPWNLYDLLEDFLDLQGIPRGPLLLRDWSLRTLRAGEPHKLAAIQALLDTYPGLQVVLVGDCGERDPEIYRQVVLRHPGRVLAVYVRDVAPGRRAAVRAIAAELAGHGVDLVFSPDTEAARRHALDHGLIVAAALPGDR